MPDCVEKTKHCGFEMKSEINFKKRWLGYDGAAEFSIFENSKNVV
jgi:hypothetical protein